MIEIARLAQEHSSIDWLCTAGTSEALLLRERGITKKIIAMSFVDTDYDSPLIHNIHLAIYERSQLIDIQQAAYRTGRRAYVHLKVDTGMSRLGFLPEDVLNVIAEIGNYPGIYVCGIFTHLANPLSSEFSQKQNEQFEYVLDNLIKKNISLEYIHAFSSSGLLCLGKNKRHSLVRPGAGLFGLWKSEPFYQRVREQHPDIMLKSVLTWKTRIIHIKTVSAGSYVGYNGTFRTARETILAVLPVGYCDGYRRSFTNTGVVEVRGRRASVVGVVSMNMTTLDVTDIPGVVVGDQVTLIGNQKGVLAHECAERAGVITNELVVGIAPALVRYIV
jgi:alanine racemase